jgi:hypothetical protein
MSEDEAFKAICSAIDVLMSVLGAIAISIGLLEFSDCPGLEQRKASSMLMISGLLMWIFVKM